MGEPIKLANGKVAYGRAQAEIMALLLEEREEIASEPVAEKVDTGKLADWTKVRGVGPQINNALHFIGLSTKDALLKYFVENGIEALTAIPAVDMKRARALIAFAQDE